MLHLISVHDEFHARVIAARLGSDGIVTELRPPPGGPYPLVGEVQVYVGEGDFPLARELLLADADDLDASPPDDSDAAPRPPVARPAAIFALALVLVVGLVLLAISRAA